MKLPVFLTQIQDLSLMQTKWAAILNPFVSQPSLQNLILPNIKLEVGTTIINHRLGRKLKGWRIVRKRGLAQIYDTQDDNQKPELTLSLVSDTEVIIDLEVF